MKSINKSNEATDLLNKIGKYKKENDPKDELSLLEAVVELADKDDISLDEYTDILSDSPEFKIILEQDMRSRGLLYMDGVRAQNEELEEW